MEENKLNEELEKAEEELNEIEKNDKHKGLIIFMIAYLEKTLKAFVNYLKEKNFGILCHRHTIHK